MDVPTDPAEAPPVDTVAVDGANVETEAAEAPAEAPPLSPLLEAVLQPVSESNPIGEDVKYEDSFQQLKSEVDKVQSANADADFDRIVELGAEILGTKSKDLTVAAYLGFGLIQTQRLVGVAEGADALRILCDTYWEDMYPPLRRMVARKNAIQLLVDRAHDWLEGYKPVANDGPAIQRALDSYAAVQAIAMEQMGENAPVVSKMTRILEAKLRAVPKPKPKAPPKPEASDGSSASDAPSTSAGGDGAEVATSPDAFQSQKEAERSLMAAATYIRQEVKTAPLPFQVARALRWGSLVAAPPAEDGKTMIPPFVEQRKTYLEGLASGGQFAELIDEAEASFYDQPFWLDIQRYVVTSMDALGAPFAAARDAVIMSLAMLIQRVPEITSLAFENGAPFADAATQEWIDLKVRTALGGDGGGARPTSDGSALDEAFAAARDHLTTGNLDEAIAELSADGDAAGRDRFRRRLYLATLCVRGGQPGVARALLERLGEEIAARDLGAWEPDLCVEVWTALHGCYGALLRSAAAPEKEPLRLAASRTLDYVSALDPAAALALVRRKS